MGGCVERVILSENEPTRISSQNGIGRAKLKTESEKKSKGEKHRIEAARTYG